MRWRLFCDPLSGRILLPVPAYERFVAKHAVV